MFRLWSVRCYGMALWQNIGGTDWSRRFALRSQAYLAIVNTYFILTFSWFFPSIVFHPLLRYPGSWFFIYNLILTPLDDLCKIDGSDYLTVQYWRRRKILHRPSVRLWSPGPILVPRILYSLSIVILCYRPTLGGSSCFWGGHEGDRALPGKFVIHLYLEHQMLTI